MKTTTIMRVEITSIHPLSDDAPKVIGNYILAGFQNCYSEVTAVKVEEVEE